MNYNFEWDVQKAVINELKHKVSFESAATIFHDPRALTIYDRKHSDFEDRWITSGIAGNKSILVVVHTYVETDDESVIIRIISARKATKKEIKQYLGEKL